MIAAVGGYLMRAEAVKSDSLGRALNELTQEFCMPFVNIRILEGQSQENKDEISRRVTEAITDVTGLPEDAVWVVFDGVGASDWYVGATTVAELRKRST
jgi:4-oxalocrotonate tautomerase